MAAWDDPAVSSCNNLSNSTKIEEKAAKATDYYLNKFSTLLEENTLMQQHPDEQNNKETTIRTEILQNFELYSSSDTKQQQNFNFNDILSTQNADSAKTRNNIYEYSGNYLYYNNSNDHFNYNSNSNADVVYNNDLNNDYKHDNLYNTSPGNGFYYGGGSKENQSINPNDLYNNNNNNNNNNNYDYLSKFDSHGNSIKYENEIEAKFEKLSDHRNLNSSNSTSHANADSLQLSNADAKEALEEDRTSQPISKEKADASMQTEAQIPAHGNQNNQKEEDALAPHEIHGGNEQTLDEILLSHQYNETISQSIPALQGEDQEKMSEDSEPMERSSPPGPASANSSKNKQDAKPPSPNLGRKAELETEIARKEKNPEEERAPRLVPLPEKTIRIAKKKLIEIASPSSVRSCDSNQSPAYSTNPANFETQVRILDPSTADPTHLVQIETIPLRPSSKAAGTLQGKLQVVPKTIEKQRKVRINGPESKKEENRGEKTPRILKEREKKVGIDSAVDSDEEKDASNILSELDNSQQLKLVRVASECESRANDIVKKAQEKLSEAWNKHQQLIEVCFLARSRIL